MCRHWCSQMCCPRYTCAPCTLWTWILRIPWHFFLSCIYSMYSKENRHSFVSKCTLNCSEQEADAPRVCPDCCQKKTTDKHSFETKVLPFGKTCPVAVSLVVVTKLIIGSVNRNVTASLYRTSESEDKTFVDPLLEGSLSFTYLKGA